jgi:DNA-directed RNA polymerase alpha subunit
MRDLVRLQKTDWLKFRTSGKKSLTELDDFIKDHDLKWGMNV